MSDTGGHELMVRKACPCCGSTVMRSVLRYPFDATPVREYLVAQYEGRVEFERLVGGMFDVALCEQCGLVFQRIVPVGDLLQTLYNGWIASDRQVRLWKQYRLNTYRDWVGQVDFAIQYFGLLPSEVRVFDFGCGWSEWLKVGRALGCQVAGAELSQDRREYAHSIGIPIIDWDDIPEHTFHFINTEQVFEHLIEPRETLARLAGSLYSGGLMRVSVPDGRGILKRLEGFGQLRSWPKKQLLPIAPLEHVNCFCFASLAAFGREVGLHAIRPSVRLLYNSVSGWFEPRQAARNLLRPLYRHVFPKSTVVYFRKV